MQNICKASDLATELHLFCIEPLICQLIVNSSLYEPYGNGRFQSCIYELIFRFNQFHWIFSISLMGIPLTNCSPIPADTSVPLKRDRKPPWERSTWPSKKKRLNSDTSTTIDPDSHIQAAETRVSLSQPSSSSTKSEHEATTEAPAAATPIKIKLKRQICKARPPALPPGTTVTYPSCKHKFLFLSTSKKENLSNGKPSLMKLRKMTPTVSCTQGLTRQQCSYQFIIGFYQQRVRSSFGMVLVTFPMVAREVL